MTHRQVLDVRDELLEVANRLVGEFAGRHTPGRVLRCVERARVRLWADGAREDLPERTEELARAMLRHPSMSSRTLAEGRAAC